MSWNEPKGHCLQTQTKTLEDQGNSVFHIENAGFLQSSAGHQIIRIFLQLETSASCYL
jgi:hypothetical protein